MQPRYFRNIVNGKVIEARDEFHVNMNKFRSGTEEISYEEYNAAMQIEIQNDIQVLIETRKFDPSERGVPYHMTKDYIQSIQHLNGVPVDDAALFPELDKPANTESE